ncbi:MAG TPA: polysaccharide deacetylase family protein [Streptosporangiaceae bacterium]|jgi:peptidoglycan/xylan/chitin deacetylase (PgdA/CDA1 family)
MINQLRRLASRSGAATSSLIALAALAFAAPAGSAQAASRECRNGYVGLTYDDGPTAATLPSLLAALKKARARATFFNQGNRAVERPDLVHAELKAGHWVGTHTITHPHLPQIGEPAAFDEIAGAEYILKGITGRWPTLFRPPFGETSDQVRADEQNLGVLEVLWTVDSQDWNGATVDQIVAASDTLQPGGIMLEHDWAQNTIDALPIIVEHLKARGLCPGKIVYTPQNIPYSNTFFHAIAVKP